MWGMGRHCYRWKRTAAVGPGCVKARSDRHQSINFSRFSAVFRHYRVGEAKKFASDAPFSDNFRVFTQVRRETGKE